MRRWIVTLVVLGCVASWSERASAQDGSIAAPQLSELSLAPDARLADARYLRDVGMALTLNGLATVAWGAPLIFAQGTMGIPGGVFTGLGGLLALAGIPTWIVGGIRSDILAASIADRDRISWNYELAGIVTTLLSIGVSLAGGAMILAGAAAGRASGESSTSGAVMGTGAAMIPIGFFVATFIGVPMWAEGARF